VGDNRAIESPPPSLSPPAGAGPGRWARLLAEWVLPPENPSGAVYGVIMMGALLAAESGRKETYAETFASAVIAACVYWLAHAYATGLGRRLRARDALTARGLAVALVHDWALIRGAAIPLLALVVAWVTGAAQQTAVDAALYSVVASLIAFELIAGILSRATRAELALEVGVGVAMGLGVLALHIVLH